MWQLLRTTFFVYFTSKKLAIENMLQLFIRIQGIDQMTSGKG